MANKLASTCQMFADLLIRRELLNCNDRKLFQ